MSDHAPKNRCLCSVVDACWRALCADMGCTQGLGTKAATRPAACHAPHAQMRTKSKQVYHCVELTECGRGAMCQDTVVVVMLANVSASMSNSAMSTRSTCAENANPLKHHLNKSGSLFARIR